MKKIYQAPESTVEVCLSEDILTASALSFSESGIGDAFNISELL